MKNEIPKYLLKDIATITAGQSPESKYYNTSGDGLPFFQGKADFGPLYPEIKNYCSQPTKIAEKDDILLSVRAPVGPTNLAPCKVCIGRGLTAIRPNSSICLKYLLYFFRYYEAQLQKSGTGTTFKAITQNVIKNIEVPVPDLTEQERIVSKIEELFSRLDASVAELQTAKEKLKVYRQAVLKEALSSKEGWHKYHFSDLMEGVRNGYGKKPDDAGKYRILRISSVRPGKVDLSDYRTNQAPFDKSDLIAENDLLFTRYNGSLEYVGVCACVPQLQENYAYPDKIIKCTPKLKNKYHSKFIQYCMNQGQVREYIRSKIKTTSGQKGIAGSDIKKAVLWLPELSVQEIIVKKIDAEMSVCDSIEQAIDASLRQAEALRQSILKQAFEGEL